MATKKKQPKPPPAPTRLDPRKQWLFRIAALSLPLAFLGLVEFLLRLNGFGGYPQMLRKVGKIEGRDLVVAEQGGAISWFFANAHRMGSTEQQTFLHPKPTNQFRIFLVGESAVQGFPQPRHLAASAFLQAMLQDVWPERRVEVINLGTTAVASFPVRGIMDEALEYEPDLIVIYTGNNEFFGTYGVASIGRAGSKPWMLKLNRFLYSLGIVQGLGRWLSADKPDFDRTLMESMMANSFIGAGDWQRKAAANNLQQNVTEMLQHCRARGVPALVCSLPANERDLAPIGIDSLDGVPREVCDQIETHLSAATLKLQQRDFAGAIQTLHQLLMLHPNHARAHYLLGQARFQQGLHAEALSELTLARDLDSMPWRPPSQSQDAVVRAARNEGVPVCDLLKAFREASPGGAIGWELMDDHVHPTLQGQALIAESILRSLGEYPGALHVSEEARAKLPVWTEYARRLGENVYDRFRVANSVRKLFNAQFMRANNPEAYRRFDAIASGVENQFSPEIREVIHEWEATRPFAGARCPITAAVAQLKLKQRDYEDALRLFQIARREVPDYTSWQLEYSYYLLLCRQKLAGSLDATDRAMALTAIKQGHFLADHFVAANGFIERFTGMLHFLLGEYAEAARYLELGRAKCTGFDLMALDQALVVCHLQTRHFEKARALATQGATSGGEYSRRYQALLDSLPNLEKAILTSTNGMGVSGTADH